MAKRKPAKGRKQPKKKARKPARKGKKRASKKRAGPSVYDHPPRKSKKPFKLPVRSALERKLDEGLKQTFPASDPPAMVEPAPTPPGNGNNKPG